MRMMLFARDYHGFSGGHLKYLHYLRHTLGIPGIMPRLYMSPASIADDRNIFLASGAPIDRELRPADAYFVAGTDWALFDAAGIDMAGCPVVNLVQGVHHGDPANPRYAYLTRPALRICVGPEVAAAVAGSGQANGPIVTIRNGLDLSELDEQPAARRPGRIFIGGMKAPDLAGGVAGALAGEAGLDIDLSTGPVDRPAFLARMRTASLCILLPLPVEGFFLPALEAMALGVPVIVTDCIGNRSYCRDGETCLMPDRDAGAIAAAARRLLASPALCAEIAEGGRRMALNHSLPRERDAYVAALSAYLEPWRERGDVA
jgi:hypothetical protein